MLENSSPCRTLPREPKLMNSNLGNPLTCGKKKTIIANPIFYNTCVALEVLLTSELGNEIIPKLDKCISSKIICWWLKTSAAQKLPGTGLRSSGLMILLLFHLPAKGCSKSQRCVKPGPWFTALQENKRCKAFPIRQFKCMNCDDWQWPLKKPNQPNLKINCFKKPS